MYPTKDRDSTLLCKSEMQQEIQHLLSHPAQNSDKHGKHQVSIAPSDQHTIKIQYCLRTEEGNQTNRRILLYQFATIQTRIREITQSKGSASQ